MEPFRELGGGGGCVRGRWLSGSIGMIGSEYKSVLSVGLGGRESRIGGRSPLSRNAKT